MSKWIVYISSTFRDLKDFRADLINLFQNQLKNNFELSEIMERMFDDGTYTPYVDDCVEAVIESDIYIIILGNRTGSFPPDEDRTYTEIELDTALSNDKKIFCLRLEEFDEAEIDNKAKHDELLSKFKGRPIHKFKDTKDLKSALYEFLIQFTSEAPINVKNPYKGLAAFSVDDGDYFFGRDAELDSCIKKILTSEGDFFLSVIGNSGTGKSSFVQAGILFRLKHKEKLGFSNRIQIIVKPGSEPFTNLKYQLQLHGISPEDLTAENSIATSLILFFDQFEEVITQCHSPEAQAERKQLFEFLDILISNKKPSSRIFVITAFRSDFLSQLANYDFIKNQQLLFPLSSLDYKVHIGSWEESIKEIITRPALKNGVAIEKELVDQLTTQIKDIDGSLPILQFTLERIWNKETIEDRYINSTEYNKLSEGKGISGIIEVHAENVIKSITNNGRDKEREAILKSIFVNLVEVNENLLDVKRTVTKNELFAILQLYPKNIVVEVFEALVSEKSRLLSVTKDKDRSVYVNIIHEVLIRKWERLKGWIDERREALQYKKRLTLDIAAFDKGEENLYSGKKLKQANQWKIKNPDLTSDYIIEFLINSKKRKKSRIYLRILASILSLSALAIVFFIFFSPEKNLLRAMNNNFSLAQDLGAAEGKIDSVKSLNILDNKAYEILNKNLKYFENLEKLRIEEVSMISDLTLLNNIKNAGALKYLAIHYNSLKSLQGIEKFTNLNSLEIFGNHNLTSLAGIESLTNLNTLEIFANHNLMSLAGIENLKDLDSLTLIDLNLTNLKRIKNLTTLKFLNIGNNQSLTSLKGIENLNSLLSLEIGQNEYLTSLQEIKKLTTLKSLSIIGCEKLTSLTGIESLTAALNSLSIVGSKKLTNLEGLENLNSLSSLLLLENENLTSLVGIENLTALKSLSIDRMRNHNYDAIYELSGLERLSARADAKIDIERIQKKNPEVRINLVDW